MINIFGAINSLGYGIVCKNIIKSLTESNEKLTLTPIGQIDNDPHYIDSVSKAIKNLEYYDAKDPSFYLFHDEMSQSSSGKPNFVLSMFEGTIIKPKSINMLKYGPADIIITPTKKHRDILIENSIENKPIEVLNFGVDDSIYNTLSTDPWIKTNKFTFLTVGKNEKRKATNTVIRSFIKNFIDKDVALICHTFNPFINRTNENPYKNLSCWTGINPIQWGFEYKGMFERKYHLFSKDKCDLYFTIPEIQTLDMPRLYKSANVGIQTSLSEGWDLPLNEMLACGIPCITTDCLGHNEILEPIKDNLIQKNLIIQPNGKELANDGIWFNGTTGYWDTFDENVLDEMLLTVYNNNSFEVLNEDISESIISSFNWRKTANRIKQLSGAYVCLN